jgi:hypothetical protein
MDLVPSAPQTWIKWKINIYIYFIHIDGSLCLSDVWKTMPKILRGIAHGAGPKVRITIVWTMVARRITSIWKMNKPKENEKII